MRKLYEPLQAKVDHAINRLNLAKTDAEIAEATRELRKIRDEELTPLAAMMKALAQPAHDALAKFMTGAPLTKSTKG